MCVLSDDELSTGLSEEECNVWNKVLVLACHFTNGPCLQGYLIDIETETLALSCPFALDILCEEGALARSVRTERSTKAGFGRCCFLGEALTGVGTSSVCVCVTYLLQSVLVSF